MRLGGFTLSLWQLVQGLLLLFLKVGSSRGFFLKLHVSHVRVLCLRQSFQRYLRLAEPYFRPSNPKATLVGFRHLPPRVHAFRKNPSDHSTGNVSKKEGRFLHMYIHLQHTNVCVYAIQTPQQLTLLPVGVHQLGERCGRPAVRPCGLPPSVARRTLGALPSEGALDNWVHCSRN